VASNKKTRKSPARRNLATIQAYKDTFNSPQGRKVLHDMLDAHGMMRNTYNGNVNDMLLKEGERLVVLRILSKLNINVQELRERIEEHVKSLED
jgi:hypothetical protein